MRMTPGISFVELLILILIVGILSVIVVPELTEASLDTRTARLQSQLYAVRAKLRVYQKDHNGQFPSGQAVVDQMTLRTNADGQIMPIGASLEEYPLGPYLHSFPRNPYARRSVAGKVEVGTNAPGGGNAGWFYDPQTGHFFADSDGQTHF